MRQHLTAVNAAARVCNADVDGAEIGATSIKFEPHEICGGNFEFKVGTAGSAPLIAQTVLPALMLTEASSTVVLEGGTHNPWAPPFDFLQRAFLPQLAKFGPRVSCEIESYGFFPAGGGKFAMRVTPSEKLQGIELLTRGSTPRPSVQAIVSAIPRSVGERECDTIRRKSNWHSDSFHVHEVVDPPGPGNVVMIELVSDNVTEIFIGFGKVGVKAEHIASSVLREARSYLKTTAPAGQYLADQLMLPMGVAARQGRSSTFRTVPLSKHSQTHLEVLKIFLDFEVAIEPEPEGTVIVSFTPS
jgi:RNA 3'-terminal phosphate cyclase (ATP)